VIGTLPKIVAEIGRPRFFDAVLDWIVDAIPVDAAEVFSFTTDAGPAQLTHRQRAASFVPVMRRPYAEIYEQDPLYHAFRDRLPPGMYDPRRLMRSYPRNRFYDDYYWDRDVGELNLLVPHGRDQAAVIYLGWSKGARTVSQSNLRELEMAEPILRACIEKHVSLREAAIEPEARSSVLDHCGLTTREMEVARRMLHGDNVKATAGRLRIAQGTVQIHRKSIYRKLNVRCLTEFYAFCGVIDRAGAQ